MTEYIAEKIRDAVLSGLPWMSRSAGLTEPVQGAKGTYPGARRYTGDPCAAVGDYINMAPQETETAIAFVDWDGDNQKVYSNARLYDFKTYFRVVVWFDERKVTVDAGSLMFALQGAITAGIRAVNFNTDGLLRTKAILDSAQLDPVKVWSKYQMQQQKQGLFLLPYRTFALRFMLMGRVVPECFTGTITADQNAC